MPNWLRLPPQVQNLPVSAFTTGIFGQPEVNLRKFRHRIGKIGPGIALFVQKLFRLT
jgi:hypothetical protein